MILDGAMSTRLTLNEHVGPYLLESFFLRIVSKNDFKHMISVSKSKNVMLLVRAAYRYAQS